MPIMPIARATPGGDRRVRFATALLLAIAVLAALVLPALGAERAVPVRDVVAPAAETATPAPTPTPWPTPAWPTAVTTLGSSVKFYGLGYGHGVGLSQYGARGRALAGQTAEQILKAYFKGITLSTTSPTRTVRVLLLSTYSASSSSPLVIYGRSGTWGLTGTDLAFPANARLTVWRTTATVNGVTSTVWKAKVVASDLTTVLYTATLTGSPNVSPIDAATRLQLDSKPSTYDTYRGKLTLVLGSSSVNVVNRLGLDSYLKGVVPVEMPSSWPLEALRAQAIASRSYAVKRLHLSTGTYDLYDDSRTQVYRGVEAEKSVTNDIIDAKPGAIMLYGTSVVNAFYFSTGGGATESNEYVFNSSTGSLGTPVAYLRGIMDRSPAGVPYDGTAPYYKWTSSTLTLAQLSAVFKADSRTNVGDLLKLDLRKRGVSGRLYKVVLYGTLGSKTVSGELFKSVYNAHRPSGTALLRSTALDTRPIP